MDKNKRKKVTKNEAKEKIKKIIEKAPSGTEFRPDEIAEKLHIDYEIVMEIVIELMDENEIELV